MSNGAPGEIRTPDLQLRRLPLYPAELRARSLQSTSGFQPHQMLDRQLSRFRRDPSQGRAGLPAAAATAATAALAPTTSAATTAPGTALRLRTCFVYIQSASPYLRAVQRCDCLFTILSARHLDKPKAPGTSSITVGHDRDTIDLSIRFEQLAQFVFRRVEIQVSNKDVLQARASGWAI